MTYLDFPVALMDSAASKSSVNIVVVFLTISNGLINFTVLDGIVISYSVPSITLSNLLILSG